MCVEYIMGEVEGLVSIARWPNRTGGSYVWNTLWGGRGTGLCGEAILVSEWSERYLCAHDVVRFTSCLLALFLTEGMCSCLLLIRQGELRLQVLFKRAGEGIVQRYTLTYVRM